jgi:hypothetical protein
VRPAAPADWAIELRERFGGNVELRSYGEQELARIQGEIRSENSRKAMLRRRRCKLATCGALTGKGELYCKNHLEHDPLHGL